MEQRPKVLVTLTGLSLKAPARYRQLPAGEFIAIHLTENAMFTEIQYRGREYCIMAHEATITPIELGAQI